jgi:hypothetical protein
MQEPPVKIGECLFFYLSAGHKSCFVSSSAWNPCKLSGNFSLSCCQEWMHPSRSLEYQFATASSREMMRDLAMVASSPPAETMVAS